jgi:predicted secreted acid phosphatase
MKGLKNLELKESLENCQIFRQQSKENQRFDLLGLTSLMMQQGNNIVDYCKDVENKIDTIREPKLLLNQDDFTDELNSLSLEVTNLIKKYARFNSFIEIYLKDKI